MRKVPKDVGQSGTESPASFEVTRAPAMISKKVVNVTKAAYRLSLGLVEHVVILNCSLTILSSRLAPRRRVPCCGSIGEKWRWARSAPLFLAVARGLGIESRRAQRLSC